MSIFSIITNKAYGYEDAFGAGDCTSQEMKDAIAEWFELFYRKEPTKYEDPCQRIPYTIVNKITKTAFGEYKAVSENDFAGGIMDALYDIHARAMHDALIGGWHT